MFGRVRRVIFINDQLVTGSELAAFVQLTTLTCNLTYVMFE